jgi:hypothetical protein
VLLDQRGVGVPGLERQRADDVVGHAACLPET